MMRTSSTLNRKRKTARWHYGIHAVAIVICILALVPLLLIISSSFTDEQTLAQYGYQLIPLKFSAYAYQFLFRDPSQLINSYTVSLTVTIVGTAVSLLVTSMLAYAMSRRDFALRHLLAFFVFFTLLFNGGLVPYYILMSQTLHLKNNILALILPYLVTPFFVLLLRTYFASLPRELMDAAKMDGASEWRIFFQIVVPLSTPALATVGLFSVLLYWNDFYQALLFIDDQKLYPLQYLLYILSHNNALLQANETTQGTPTPYVSVQMAMAVLALGPVAFAFLFVQRFFVRGITLGGLKGE